MFRHPLHFKVYINSLAHTPSSRSKVIPQPISLPPILLIAQVVITVGKSIRKSYLNSTFIYLIEKTPNRKSSQKFKVPTVETVKSSRKSRSSIRQRRLVSQHLHLIDVVHVHPNFHPPYKSYSKCRKAIWRENVKPPQANPFEESRRDSNFSKEKKKCSYAVRNWSLHHLWTA